VTKDRSFDRGLEALLGTQIFIYTLTAASTSISMLGFGAVRKESKWITETIASWYF